MIAVSGAGIAGMAAVIAARANGHDVTVIGTPAAQFAGGVQLAPNGWAALQTLGVADVVAKEAVNLHDITVRDLNSLSTITRLPLPDHYRAVSRQHLFTCLSNAAIGPDNGPSSDATSFTSYEDVVRAIDATDGGVTLVTDAHGLHRVDALIAADGMAGLGRRYVLGDDPTRAATAHKVALRAEIDAALLPTRFSLPASNLWLGNGMHVVHYPLGDTVNVVVTIPAQRDTPDIIAELFTGHSAFDPLTNPAIRWARTPLPRASNAACWRRGMVVLAGDAAHIMPPHLAQGAGQSLEDAASLHQCLGTEPDLHSALSTYAVTRARAVARVADKANMSGHIMGMGGAAGRLRNMVLDLGGTRLMNGWLADVWAGDKNLTR